MKCSGCGFVGPGKFCQECGGKMVNEDQEGIVILCDGKVEDGMPCNAELKPSGKFCFNCGKKIDPALFNIDTQKDISPGAVTGTASSAGETSLSAESSTMKPDGHSSGENEENMEIGKEQEDTEGPVNVDNKGNEGETIQGIVKDKPISIIEGSGDAGETSLSDQADSTKSSPGSELTIQISKKGMEPDEKSEEKPSDEEVDLRNKGEDTPSVQWHRGLKGNVKMEENNQPTATVSSPDNGNQTVDNCPAATLKDGTMHYSSTEEVISSSSEDNVSNANKACSGLPEKMEEVKLDGIKEKHQVEIKQSTDMSKTDLSASDSEESSDSESDRSVMANSVSSEASSEMNKGQSQKRGKKQRKTKKIKKRERKARKALEKDSASVTDCKDSASATDNITAQQHKSVIVADENLGKSVQETQDQHNITDQTKPCEKVFGNGTNPSSSRNDGMPHTPVSNVGLFSNLHTSGNTTKGTQKTTEKPEENERKSDLGAYNDEESDGSDDEMEDENNDDEKEIDRKAAETSSSKESGSQHEGTNVDGAEEKRDQLTKSQKKNLRKKEAKAKNKGKEESGIKNKNGVANQSKQGLQDKATRIIQVKFHVLMSESFKFDPEEHKVILRMEDGTGNWNNTSRVCKVVRKESDHVYELEFEMKIPITRLKQGIQYKYCIQEKPDKEQYLWEHYLRRYNSGSPANRVLYLPNKWNGDVWQQYDGFIEKEPTGFSYIKNMWSWKKELVKHATKSCGYFCKKILVFDEPSSMSSVMEQLEMLLTCYKKIYLHDSSCWDQIDNFREEIGGVILEVLLESGDNKKTTDLSAEGREKPIAMALAAVLAIEKFNLPLGKIKSLQVVCEQLIMHPDPEKKICFEMVILKKYFAEDGNRKQIKDGFLHLAQHIAYNNRNPSWLFLVPWIHFLCGVCTPYEDIKFDTGHNKQEPTWWGITDIGENPIHYFAGKTDAWEIPIKKTLEMIEPLFELDYFLPRTFVTAVRLKELSNVIKTGKIPVEVCLANLYYHIIKTRPSYSYGYLTTDEIQVAECIEALLTLLDDTDKRFECNVHQEKMKLFISSQLVIECTKTNRARHLIGAVGIMLHCSASFDAIPGTKTRAKTSDSEIQLQECFSAVNRWFDKYNWNFTQYLEAVLFNMNAMFGPRSIGTSAVCEQWNMQLSIVLLEKLNKFVCSDRWIMTSFVQLYCQKVDSFHPLAQDVLTKSAFKAIEGGYSIDYAKFHSTEIIRFGGLISGLFLKEWDKVISPKHIDCDIIQHSLKWPPFLQFLKIYGKDQEKLKLLSHECVERLVTAVSIIECQITSLLNGEA